MSPPGPVKSAVQGEGGPTWANTVEANAIARMFVKIILI